MIEALFLNPGGRAKASRKRRRPSRAAPKAKPRRKLTAYQRFVRSRLKGKTGKRSTMRQVAREWKERGRSTGGSKMKRKGKRKKRLSTAHRRAISRGVKRASRGSTKRRRRSNPAPLARRRPAKSYRRKRRSNPRSFKPAAFMPRMGEVQQTLAGAAGFALTRGLSGQFQAFLPVQFRPVGVPGSTAVHGFNVANMIGTVVDFAVATVGVGFLSPMLPSRFRDTTRQGALIGVGFNLFRRFVQPAQLAAIPILGPGLSDYVVMPANRGVGDYVTMPNSRQDVTRGLNGAYDELPSSGALVGEDLPGSGSGVGQYYAHRDAM